MASNSKFSPQKTIPALAVTVCIVVLVVVAVAALLQIGPFDTADNRLPDRFDYNIQHLREIDPSLIKYEQAMAIPLEMAQPRAVAVGPGDKIYVGGDSRIDVYRPDGQKLTTLRLEFEPRAIAVAPERIFVAGESRVVILDKDGGRLASWPDRGRRALFTSIALDTANDYDAYVADAGNKIVLRYDSAGKLLGDIGGADVDKDDPKAATLGFIIPSPFFDLAMGSDGLLRVVNPGLHRIQAFTPEGLLEKPLTWGKTGYDIEGFCGCCNPASMAMLPDGRFVTGEKGLPRVKVYSPEGHFQCVVAGPKTLDPTLSGAEDTRDKHKLTAVDLAVDSRARILVLDPSAKSVRVFVHKSDTIQP